MSQPIRGQGGHHVFSDQPEKHKLGRGRWDVDSRQVSLNSIQQFQRRIRKCFSRSEARTVILFFPIGPKNTNLAANVEILLLVKFRWIPLSGFRGKVENVSANQRPGWPSCFSDRHEEHKVCRGRWDLATSQISLNTVRRFKRRCRKCFSQSEARTVILFSDRPEKHIHVLVLGRGRCRLRSCFLSSFVEFRSAVSEEKSKMSRPGRPSCSSDRPENTNLVEDVEI